MKRLKRKPRVTRGTYYPWEKWIKHEEDKTTLIKNNEYHATQTSMCVMIRHRARLMHLLVSVFPKGNGDIEVITRGTAL